MFGNTNCIKANETYWAIKNDLCMNLVNMEGNENSSFNDLFRFQPGKRVGKKVTLLAQIGCSLVCLFFAEWALHSRLPVVLCTDHRQAMHIPLQTDLFRHLRERYLTVFLVYA